MIFWKIEKLKKLSKVNFILFVLILWLKYKNSIQTEIFIFKNFFLSVVSLKFIAFIFFKKSQVSIINRICEKFPQLFQILITFYWIFYKKYIFWDRRWLIVHI